MPSIGFHWQRDTKSYLYPKIKNGGRGNDWKMSKQSITRRHNGAQEQLHRQSFFNGRFCFVLSFQHVNTRSLQHTHTHRGRACVVHNVSLTKRQGHWSVSALAEQTKVKRKKTLCRRRPDAQGNQIPAGKRLRQIRFHQNMIIAVPSSRPYLHTSFFFQLS